MLYMGTDGTIVVDDRPYPANLWSEEDLMAAKRRADNTARYAEMEAQVARIELEREIAAEVAEQMMAGVSETEREFAREAAERDALIELVELAEEAAMTELEAFGSVWPEDGVSQAEYDETLEEFWEFACDLYEVGETWNERLVLTELY